MPLTRRSLLGSLAVLGVAVPGLTACGATGKAAAGADDAVTGTSDGPEDGAFPVTIAHKFGETTLTEQPTRIVCVGLKDQDDLLALGIVPVGASTWLELGQGGVIGPWAEAALDGRPAPQALETADGIAFEAVAGLAPDLVLALYAGLTAEDYEKLSAIAPVVAAPEGFVDYGIPWDVEAEVVGRAVGRPARMAELVAASKQAVADAAAAHPAFAGRTALVATPYEGIYVYGEQDPRTRLLTSLGFVLPDGFAEALGDTGNTFGGTISDERADLLDVDALVCFADAGDQQQQIETAVFRRFAVAREERVVWLRSADAATDPFSFLTVLSLPYLLENFVDRVAAAVDGDPATSSEQEG
ncbi:ABC transporter substrate-binding protein [Microlunatus capsulatus]|uniref:Iron complex transport system substrate-binding protein n=1 Tax=Microlunatus capsulatus TaxID=99117 RepID=A0ABS4Z5B2_9ACTN|nr:ABC transporter substrate-binding protein [Microlunatus capsulatus]MBP2416159.1 iron complex transport system substrate-binding protein [Microlunatus capsulatus]